MAYCAEADVEAVLCMTIDTSSRPTSTQLATMITQADKIINAEVIASSNMTDTYGELKSIAISLVYKMIMNAYAITHPELYTPMEVELTPEQRRTVHMVHGKWTADTFDVDDVYFTRRVASNWTSTMSLDDEVIVTIAVDVATGQGTQLISLIITQDAYILFVEI